jgi:hypothetical protein
MAWMCGFHLDVRVPLQRRTEGLYDGDHTGPRVGLLKQLGENRCTLRPTGWAEPSAFAGEGDEKLGATPRANDAGKT